MNDKKKRSERVSDFWAERPLATFLVSDETVKFVTETLKKALDGKSFELLHAQAIILAVSTIESQVRDCVRLSIDDPRSIVDFENAFLKDFKFDQSLLGSMRQGRFSLGQFVFFNTGISTPEKLWSALEFSLDLNFEAAFNQQTFGVDVKPTYPFDELKRSLAWLFDERNIYVHEFSDITVKQFGSEALKDEFDKNILRIIDFIVFLQKTIKDRFESEWDEAHPVRGEIAKEINELSRRIREKFSRLEEVIRAHQVEDEYNYPWAMRALKRLDSLYKDYVTAVSELSYYLSGPGSIRNDFAAYHNREALKTIDELLDGFIKIKEEEPSEPIPD